MFPNHNTQTAVTANIPMKGAMGVAGPTHSVSVAVHRVWARLGTVVCSWTGDGHVGAAVTLHASLKEDIKIISITTTTIIMVMTMMLMTW